MLLLPVEAPIVFKIRFYSSLLHCVYLATQGHLYNAMISFCPI